MRSHLFDVAADRTHNFRRERSVLRSGQSHKIINKLGDLNGEFVDVIEDRVEECLRDTVGIGALKEYVDQVEEGTALVHGDQESRCRYLKHPKEPSYGNRIVQNGLLRQTDS